MFNDNSTRLAYRKICRRVILFYNGMANKESRSIDEQIERGSRNLVGIAIQLSDSEQEKLLVGYPMLISPEKFDFGIE